MSSMGLSTVYRNPEQVYSRLRELAAGYLKRERAGHTLQPTALVHEAYLRLLATGGLGGLSGRELVGAAARAMRHVLVDSARRHNAIKRQGHRTAASPELETVARRSGAPPGDLLALDEALDRLGLLDPELLILVELRFFGGLTEDQVAQHLGVSSRTVARSWRFVRAWLAAELREDDAP